MAIVRLAILWLGIILVTSAFTCENKKPVRTGEVLQRQVIIKFKPGIKTTAGKKLLATLEGNTGIGMEYIKPMSGNAHVIKLKGLPDQKTLEKILQQLNDHKDVEYAEEDIKMQIQMR